MRPTLVYEVSAEGEGRSTFTRTIEMEPGRPVPPEMRRHVTESNEEFVGNLKRVLEAAPAG